MKFSPLVVSYSFKHKNLQSWIRVEIIKDLNKVHNYMKVNTQNLFTNTQHLFVEVSKKKIYCISLSNITLPSIRNLDFKWLDFTNDPAEVKIQAEIFFIILFDTSIDFMKDLCLHFLNVTKKNNKFRYCYLPRKANIV